jgi:hypothetical protein
LRFPTDVGIAEANEFVPMNSCWRVMTSNTSKGMVWKSFLDMSSDNKLGACLSPSKSDIPISL